MNDSMLKLLVVDDESWIFENLKSLLNWTDMSTRILNYAGDGEAALKICEQDIPDIVITDINMPFMDGNQLIKELKAISSSIQIIVLSGYDDFNLVREALLHGAIDYLLKPVNRNSLLEVISKAISNIGEVNRNAREKEEMNKRLLQASSIISDGDYSQLIDDAVHSEKEALLAQMELEFTMYTFLLFRLIDLPRLTAKGTIPLGDRIFNAKKELERVFSQSKAVIFNNASSRTEFIVLTSIDRAVLDGQKETMMASLRKLTGSRVRFFISKPNYSFDNLPNIYSAAHLSLKLRPCSDSAFFSVDQTTTTSEIRGRISAEDEKQLDYAVRKEDRDLVRDILFKNIGLTKESMGKWLVIEVNQSLDYVTGIFLYHFRQNTGTILLIEDYVYLINNSIASEDYEEVSQLLMQMIDDLFLESHAVSSSSSMQSTIERVIEYINKNYFRDISLSDLADMYSIDRSYLSRSFKNVTGETLMLYIAKTRIQKAQEYILQSVHSGNMSLTEISDLVGYSEYAYFNRVFRKIAGVSPSEYKAGVGK